MKSNSIQRIAVITSGGDAPGMNAAIRAVVRTALYHEIQVVGFYRGYDGMIENDCVELDSTSVKHTLSKGGTWLKSARSEAFRTPEGRAQAVANLNKGNINALVVIGGDGSFTGAKLLAEEHDFPVIGIPGTIDNDLYGTDYTIGYDTAVNTVIDAVDKVRDTASSHNRLFLVEVMGRDAGFIALSSAVATGGMDVVLPEETHKIEDIFQTVERGMARRKTSNIIIVAEGNRLGNTMSIADAVRMKYPDMDVKVTILGHIQRGGSPSHMDRVLASRMGVRAVEGLINDETQVMVGISQGSMVYVPFADAIEKKAPLNMDLLRVAHILST